MGCTSLELIEHEVTTYGFANSKIVAMGLDYPTLKHFCQKTYGVEPINDGDTIKRGVEKVYSIRLSEIPIIK